MYFLLGSDNGSAPDDYSSTDQARNINIWYDVAVDMILESFQGWNFNNNIATTSLVADTRQYTLSAASLSVGAVDLLQVTRVEISYDGTNYYKAKPITMAELNKATEALADADIDANAALSSQTQPRYMLGEDTIDIYPQPSAASTNGLKIYYTKGVTALSADGDVPLIPSLFFRLLSLGGAYDYAFSRGLPIAGSLRQEVEIYKQDLKEFLAIRNSDQPIIATAGNISNYED